MGRAPLAIAATAVVLGVALIVSAIAVGVVWRSADPLVPLAGETGGHGALGAPEGDDPQIVTEVVGGAPEAVAPAARVAAPDTTGYTPDVFG